MINSLNSHLAYAEIDHSSLRFIDGSATMDRIDLSADQFYPINSSSTVIGRLTMGPNSALVINPNLRFASLIINNAFLQGDVVIGVEGVSPPNPSANHADPWRTGWWQAPSGQDGQKGVSGIDGQNGQSGIPIYIKIGINALPGSLTVVSRGGKGADGSGGGQGQLGGNGSAPFTNCGKGGDGGNGGHGGDGGNGGDIIVEYYRNNDFPGQINLVSEGGRRGEGGSRGPFARGGDSCASGQDGDPGRPGLAGVDGNTTANEAPHP